MGHLEVRHLRVVKGDTAILDDVSFDVEHGECVVVLGASGAGKTALLRAVAGLESLVSGDVLVDGRNLRGVAPRHRNLAMVTQRHKLQPHLDVQRNLEFPLRARGASREETRRRVDEEARAFSLLRLLRRKPRTLSGGERQSAALARTLVRPPDVVLLDAPFVNIDPTGRQRATRELIAAKRREGTTLLVTTSDPAVAASVSDRVVALHEGKVRAAGTFPELYAAPPDVQVAQLTSNPPMNLLPATAEVTGGHVLVRAGTTVLPVERGDVRRLRPGPVQLGIRVEDLVPAAGHDPAAFELEVDHYEMVGSRTHVHGRVGRTDVTASLRRPRPVSTTTIAVSPRQVHLFDRSDQAVGHVRV